MFPMQKLFKVNITEWYDAHIRDNSVCLPNESLIVLQEREEFLTYFYAPHT